MSDYRLSAVLELRDRLTGKIRNATQSLRSAGSMAGSASASLDQVSSSMDRAGSSAGRLRQRLGSLQGNYTPTIAVRDMATPAVNRIQSSLNSLNSRTASASVRINDEATSRISRIRQELSALAGRAYNATVNIRQNGGMAAAGNRAMGALSGVASGMMMGTGAQMMGAAGMGYGIYDTIKTYKDFEYQMANVRAVTGANADEFARLTAKAKALGETTMFKASDVAMAEGYMGYAGWQTPQIEAGLPHVLNLAAAAGEDLKGVSDIVTDAMTGFGIAATDEVKVWTKSGEQMVNATQHFSDIMAALATSSNTTVGMAGESAKYAAAVVGSLYSSQSAQDKMNAFGDWAVIEGIMADAGIKGSMSGTAQRSMLTRLASLQQNAKAAREALGVDFVYQESGYDQKGLYHEKGQTRALRDIVGDIRSRFSEGMSAEDILNAAETIEGKKVSKQNRAKIGAMIEEMQANGGKMSDATKASLTNLLGGQEGLAAWLSVLTASDESWEKKLKAIDQAHNKALEMKEIKENTLEGDLHAIGSAWEALQLELMEGQGGESLRSFVQTATKDIRDFKKTLEDGFDIGDVGKLTANVITQLKDKFLQMDGVGSVLAGGALVLGLTKIISLARKAHETVKTTLSLGSAGGMGGAARTAANIPASSVGSMVVNATSVVVNGKSVAGGGATGAGGAAGRAAGGAPTILGPNGRPLPPSTTPAPAPAPTPAAPSPGVGGFLKAGAGYGALAGIFGAMDISTTKGNRDRIREEEKYSVELATKAVQEASKQLEALRNKPDSAPEDIQAATQQLQALQQELAAAEKHQQESEQMSTTMMGESVGGAVGSVAGAVIGGALGGPVGAMIGGTIGDYAGKAIGEKLSIFWQDPESKQKIAKESVQETLKEESVADYMRHADDYDKVSAEDIARGIELARGQQDMSVGDFRRMEEQGWSGGASTSIADEEPAVPYSAYSEEVDYESIAESIRQTHEQVEMSKQSTAELLSNWREIDTAITDTGTSLGELAVAPETQENLASITSELSNLEMEAGTTSGAFGDMGADATAGCAVAAEGLGSVSTAMGELPGQATTCGSEIATGINSGVPTVKSEYSGLAGWLRGLFADIGKSIDGLIAKGKSLLGIGGGGGESIPGQASGTSWTAGGWTEVNEHGGEIIDLPTGARVYPHATTLRMLREEMASRLKNPIEPTFAMEAPGITPSLVEREAILPDFPDIDASKEDPIGDTVVQFLKNIALPEIKMPDVALPALPDAEPVAPAIEMALPESYGSGLGQFLGGFSLPGFKLPEFDLPDLPDAGMPLLTPPSPAPGASGGPVSVTIQIENMNVREEEDIDRIAYKLQQLLAEAADNYNFVEEGV